jgi:hypothetical protein
MKKAILLLTFVAASFTSCKKGDETCKKCYVTEYVTDAQGKITTTETDAGTKCGDDIEAFTSKPAVQTQTVLKYNKCK